MWAVSRVGGINSAVRANFNYVFSTILQYGGAFLAVVHGISVFDGNDFGGRRHLHNMAVNLPGPRRSFHGGKFTDLKAISYTVGFVSRKWRFSTEAQIELSYTVDKGLF